METIVFKHTNPHVMQFLYFFFHFKTSVTDCKVLYGNKTAMWVLVLAGVLLYGSIDTADSGE